MKLAMVDYRKRIFFLATECRNSLINAGQLTVTALRARRITLRLKV